MKKILILLLSLLLLLPVAAFADGETVVLTEDPAALSEAEARMLNERAWQVYDTTGVLPFILYASGAPTGDTLGERAKAFFANGPVAEQAVILGVSDADVYIVKTKGDFIDTDNLFALLDWIEPENGDLFAQLNAYLDTLEALLPRVAEREAANGIGSLPSDREVPLLVDEGDLLTDAEEAELLSLLERVSTEQKCDVAVVIPRSLGSKSATDYADDYYDFGGYGQGDTKDGILFMVCLEERDWATSTAGAAQDWFDDSELYRIEDEVIPYLSSGDYFDAFRLFAERCEQVLQGVDRRPVLYLADNGGFFSDETAYKVALRTLESHSHVAGMDIVFLTENSLNGQAPEDYVRAVYEAGEYRGSPVESKIVLVVDRAASRCYGVTAGLGNLIFGDDALSELEQAVAAELGADRPLQAVETFAERAFTRIDAYNREHGTPPAPPRTVRWFSGMRAFISSIAGLVIGLITASSLKGQLKSVRNQAGATSYMRRDSLKMTDSQDIFLYANVSKVLRSSDSGGSGRSGGSSGGSHFSSSGVSHGGHSGKF